MISNKLGDGTFGNVYKGILPCGCEVAIKIVRASKEDDEDFRNEVMRISNTNHKNVIALLGYIVEGS